MERVTTGLLEWAAASRPLDRGQESGDACLVRALARVALVAVVDGLGHGPAAAAAARRAIALLVDAELEHPLVAVRRCHEGLKSTRGVVLSLAKFDGTHHAMTWLGVGNVAGMLRRSQREGSRSEESLLLRGGVVGRQLPPLRAAMLSVAPGDMLVLATDGIHPGFSQGIPPMGSPQDTADRILAEYGTSADDALVVVARYRGVFE